MSKQIVLKRSVVAVALTLASSTVVLAQQVDAAAAPMQKVFVTGSNIKRADKEGSSPIAVINRKDIEATGANTVSELIQTIPAFGSGASLDLTDGSFSKGAATASLRGLGSSSTLILLNGRRITASAYADPNQGKSAVYDLNNIPVSAIERVEIFKDGASAVYGSDAIAGVINFITKTSYQGFDVSASASANDDGEFGRKNLTGSAGFGDLQEDGYNAFFSFDLAKRDSTKIADVNDIEKQMYSIINARLNPYSSSLTSHSPFFYRERTAGARNFANSYALRADVINQVNCPASEQLVGDVNAHVLSSTSTLVGRTFCNFNLDNYTEAQSAGDDINLLSKVTFKLSDNITSFTELGFNRSDRDYLGAPRAMQSTAATTVFSLEGAPSSFQMILPVGHPDNPFSNSRSAVGLRFKGRGGSDNTNETVRFVTGLQGTTGKFDWETAALYNRNERNETYFGMLYKPTLTRVMTENRTLADTLNDPTATQDVHNRGFSQVAQIDAKASTTIGTLAGGDIGLAFGGEIRNERIGLTPSELTQRGDIVGLSNSSANGERTVKSAFVEVRTPFAKNFEMDFAGRYDKYPTMQKFVPKVGAKWTVNEVLTLRSAYAEGFRAPALTQVSPGGVQSFSTVWDTLRCPDGVNPAPNAEKADCARGISSLSAATPDLLPETSKSYSLGMILQPAKNLDILVDYYNIRKEAETALLSAGFVVEHEEDFPGRVVRDTNPATWITDANGNVVPNSGPISAVNRNYVNQGATQTSGIDIEATLRTSLGDHGRLVTKVSGSQTLTFKRAERPGDAERNLVGTIGGLSDWATSVGEIPRYRANGSVTWTKGNHSVNGNVRFVSGVSLLRKWDSHETYPQPYCYYGKGAPGGQARFSDWISTCDIKSWTTVGVGYTYTGFQNLTLSANIQNLFDARAPYASTSSGAILSGYNSQLHNGYGRYWRLTANYSFK
ncbi:TonB-dependent receptor [Pseudoduganella sp. GCM10020061]|uniref:TonB-dependent receptor n=1 Tax=Pseudoduganella sp. GCM10020061 TaxID=3317345 RepID=UPI00363BC9D9